MTSTTCSTGVLGNASLALLDAPPGIAENLRNISAAAEKAAGLTRQLLAYAGKGQFLFTDVDLARVIRSSTELMRISITRNIELVTGDVPKTLPVIRADASQIQQVVMNLVINAAEAIGPTQPGTVTVAAGVQTALPGSRPSVFLHVTDTGCGIPDETREKIFDPFFTTKFTGRGLGLAAVQGIVRSLKGTIQLESQPGFGSAFTVTLPCPENLTPAPELRTDWLPASSAAGLTVLVADDEPLIREIAHAALEKFGCRVLLASNGQQAIDAVHSNPQVDVVLLDVVMPVLGGIDAATEIRRHKPYAAILLTSGFTREETNRMGTLPPDIPFLQKPFSVQQLAAAITSALPGK